MKYMTKEWYETAQKCDLHLLLKVSKEAETFSEEYYRVLYKKEEAEYLRLQEEIANADIEDIFPEELDVCGEHADGSDLSPEEAEDAKMEYLAYREAMLEEYKTREPFNPEREKAFFKMSHRGHIKTLRSELPESILQKVADIRILALGRASASVKEEIAQYCKANNKVVQQACNAYRREYKKAFKNGEPPFAERFNFHDCEVVSCRQKGKHVVIELDNSGGFTDINKVVFKNSTVLTKETSLRGAWWLYDEIYKAENGYEIHVLLFRPQMKLLYFTIAAEEIELQ